MTARELALPVDSVRGALLELEYAVATLRAAGGGALKLWHGEKQVRTAVRRHLRRLRQEGRITLLIPGEAFSVEDETTRYLLEKLPEMSEDSALGRGEATLTLLYIGVS